MKNMKWAVAAFATICSLALMPGRVAAQDADNSIEKIEGIQTANGVLVTIQLKKPAAGVPASFSVANPARIAIDLPNTTSNLQRSAVELNQGDLRSINVVQAQGRTRVVVERILDDAKEQGVELSVSEVRERARAIGEERLVARGVVDKAVDKAVMKYPVRERGASRFGEEEEEFDEDEEEEQQQQERNRQRGAPAPRLKNPRRSRL